MVAGDLVVKVPPDPLDRVAVRAVRRQEMHVDPVPVLPQVDRHLIARVAFGVIADYVDLPVMTQLPSQVVQMRQEQSRISPLPRLTLGQEDLAGPPVDRTGEVTLLV